MAPVTPVFLECGLCPQPCFQSPVDQLGVAVNKNTGLIIPLLVITMTYHYSSFLTFDPKTEYGIGFPIYKKPTKGHFIKVSTLPSQNWISQF